MLTPLIDVVFLLLVFFILAGRFVEERSRLTLAESATGSDAGAAQPYLFVRVHSAERVDLAGEGQSLEALIEHLRTRDRGVGIVLAPTREVPLADFVTVIDALRGAGFRSMALAPE